MNAELYVDVEFEAAHHLPYVPVGHKCRVVHGHSYKVRLYARGRVESDPNAWTLGMVVDFDEIVTFWEKYMHPRLDHQDLNKVDGIYNMNPTAENLCRFILATMPQYITAVRVREAPNVGCYVRREDLHS